MADYGIHLLIGLIVGQEIMNGGNGLVQIMEKVLGGLFGLEEQVVLVVVVEILKLIHEIIRSL
ncbi:MAG: hypothetical protein ACM3PT_05785 [Deltaproteobacteria bacterium]